MNLASYDFFVVQAEEPRILQEQIDKYKNEQGFYIYWIGACPPKGVIAVICIANKQQLAARQAMRVIGTQRLMAEDNAKSLIDACSYINPETDRDTIENFIIWLYENNHKISELNEVETEKKNP